MRNDDLLANAQANSGSGRFGREKGDEESLDHFRQDTNAIIAHGEEQFVA